MVDIFGIIEGVYIGKGIGLWFLWYIECNLVLLFMILCDSDDICVEY